MGALPSLTALRAFDAAARRLSFTEAAEELSVTPAALSFQIKRLEEHLGAALFIRRARTLELTDAGRALAPGAAAAFQTLRIGWQSAQRAVATNRLTVTAGPAFTAKWLAPLLGDFAREHPEVELSLHTTLALLDLARDGIDIAVRFGLSDDAGLFSEALADEALTPVARPEIAARLAAPADLLDQTLIHDASLDFLPNPPNWARWLQEAGVAARPPSGPSFSQADHAVDMALQGGGVVLGRYSMVRRALRDGALAAPFDLALGVRAQYRIVTLPGQQDRPVVRLFREWLKRATAEPEPAWGRPRLVMVD
ncbi:MAG: transcriptional regulator GcvA [Alphaproteobacteria bacterium]|nr:transcriptional regulator GcvA [Alphaproteobacteria bacterium]